MGKIKENKRYYWIQLTQDFFKSKEVKLLRKMPGGDTYTIIYQKMLLVSLEDKGKIYYDDLAEEVSLLIDEDIEAVRMTLLFLENKGLLIRNSEREYFLEQVPEMVGSETASTRRSRKHREQKALQCNTNATPCNREIEIEQDIEQDIEQEIEQENRDRDSRSSSTNSVLENLYREFEANFGRLLAPIEIDDVKDMYQNFNAELVREALTIAIRNGKPVTKYIAKILQNWKIDRVTTVEQVRKREEERSQKYSNDRQEPRTNVPEWSNPDYKAPTLDELKVELTEDYSDDPTAF